MRNEDFLGTQGITILICVVLMLEYACFMNLWVGVISNQYTNVMI